MRLVGGDGDGGDDGACGVARAGGRPFDGAFGMDVCGSRVVVVGAVLAGGGSECSSLTTLSCATTDEGRSVTSAATIDVAIQVMAVDATVTASHSPVANNRVSGTPPECLFRVEGGLRDP